MKTSNYGFGLELDVPVAEARAMVEAALAEQGFGILTEIDVAATLKRKLDIDTAPYLILGACNPTLAHEALTVEPEVGLLLPCNVVIYDLGNGRTRVLAMDPTRAMELVDNDQVEAVARQAREKLWSALESLQAVSAGKEGD